MQFDKFGADKKMKVLVLGGCGSQGRAALYDLSRNVSVDHLLRVMGLKYLQQDP
jgi:hypothetical protein